MPAGSILARYDVRGDDRRPDVIHIWDNQEDRTIAWTDNVPDAKHIVEMLETLRDVRKLLKDTKE
jgi:hypothetical protein